MSIRRVQAMYNQRAKLYQRFFIGFLQWEKVLDAFFSANNFLRPGMRILDAGCGTGPVIKTLYRLARQQGRENIAFYGFDLTPAMLDLFQQWIDAENAKGIHLLQADVLELWDHLPGDWAGFDWIVSSAMLEYIPEERRDQALRNLKELLKANGHLLLFLTRRTWIARWTGSKWWGTNLFDQDEVVAGLQRAGFAATQFHPLPKGWDSFMMAVEARVDA